MLATLCSKPLETKAMMGKKIANILPTISLAAKAIHTAKQTSQLQRMPRIKAWVQGQGQFAFGDGQSFDTHGTNTEVAAAE